MKLRVPLSDNLWLASVDVWLHACFLEDFNEVTSFFTDAYIDAENYKDLTLIFSPTIFCRELNLISVLWKKIIFIILLEREILKLFELKTMKIEVEKKLKFFPLKMNRRRNCGSER